MGAKTGKDLTLAGLEKITLKFRENVTALQHLCFDHCYLC